MADLTVDTIEQWRTAFKETYKSTEHFHCPHAYTDIDAICNAALRATATESRLAAVEEERSKERDAIRLATIEECAGICNDVAMDMNNDSPEMRAALRCETEIRQLKEKS